MEWPKGLQTSLNAFKKWPNGLQNIQAYIIVKYFYELIRWLL